jgi:hypothetical protein
MFVVVIYNGVVDAADSEGLGNTLLVSVWLYNPIVEDLLDLQFYIMFCLLYAWKWAVWNCLDVLNIIEFGFVCIVRIPHLLFSRTQTPFISTQIWIVQIFL